MILVIKAFGVYLDMGSRPSSLIKRHGVKENYIDTSS